MRAIPRHQELPSALLALTLGGCVAPGDTSPQPLNEYLLPTAQPTPDVSPPELPTALDSTLEHMCWTAGITACTDLAALRSRLGPIRPDLTQITQVFGNAYSGDLEAKLIDEQVPAGSEDIIRIGRVEGRLHAKNGMSVGANGNFALVRFRSFDQLWTL